MLSKQETRGLARWKPLLILPLAMALVLAFAESRTVVQSGQTAVAPPASVPSPSQELSEEEMAKALKEKMVQIEEMKKKNAEKMAQLKAKLEGTTDPETKAKIAAVMKEQKLMSLEIGAKERMLQMKKLELALTKESDAAKKADMEKKLQVLKAESEEYLKKAEQVRKAEEKAKQAAEKK